MSMDVVLFLFGICIVAADYIDLKCKKWNNSVWFVPKPMLPQIWLANVGNKFGLMIWAETKSHPNSMFMLWNSFLAGNFLASASGCNVAIYSEWKRLS